MNARRLRLPCTLASILFVTLAALAAPAQAADLQLNYETDRVIAEGLSPGTDAVFFAVAHYRKGWDKIIRRVDGIVTDEDHDGTVEFIWEYGDLPYQSVWIVIDSRNNKFAAGSPPRMIDKDVGITLDDLVRDGNNIIGIVQHQRRYLEALLTHPGFGVWSMTTGDGVPGDNDGQANGRIEIAFDAMKPLHGSSPAPSIVPNGGIIAFIDGLTLEYGVSRVTGGTPPTLAQGFDTLEGGGE